MTAATNKAVASNWIEAVLNRGDISAADNILSPDVQIHHPLVDLNGVDAMKQYVGSVRAAFPDIHSTLQIISVKAIALRLGGHLRVRKRGSFEARHQQT